tara:strand:- start:3068 stop:3997 length:930 start_codon:yes stop_codon:yes gene_type:complete
MACLGWGLSEWGDDPWGGGDQVAPFISSIKPACGSTNVNINTPIVITVCDDGCSGMGIDCIRIYVNGTLVYDGTGLNTGNLNTGFKAPCNQACSSVTIATDTTTGQTCYTFKMCCTSFICGSTVTVSGTFCNAKGETVSIGDCSFSTQACNSISGIEIIDERHIVVRFNNHMLPNPTLNGALYDTASWSVLPVSGGFVSGQAIDVQAVLVEKTFLPKTVILEVSPLRRGAMYEVVGSSAILDIFKQGLTSTGHSTLLARKTKVDSMIEKLPRMYKTRINSGAEDDQKVISIWQIFAALGIEDERKSGDY